MIILFIYSFYPMIEKSALENPTLIWEHALSKERKEKETKNSNVWGVQQRRWSGESLTQAHVQGNPPWGAAPSSGAHIHS